MAPFHYFPSTS